MIIKDNKNENLNDVVINDETRKLWSLIKIPIVIISQKDGDLIENYLLENDEKLYYSKSDIPIKRTVRDHRTD